MAKMIDMEAVRAARRNLARIAAEHPELLGESSTEDWVETLAEMERHDMGKTIQVGVRFPTEVVAAVDRFAAEETEKLRATLPGMELNRADAIRTLTIAALKARGYEVETGGASDTGVTTAKKKRATSRTK